MLADPEAVTHTLFGREIPVDGYFTSVLGAPALNMGVFVGIISGFAGGVIYNKYYNYRKLPDALSFFNGKRFVPMVVIAWSVIISYYHGSGCGRWCRRELTLSACGLRIRLPHPRCLHPLSTERWRGFSFPSACIIC